MIPRLQYREYTQYTVQCTVGPVHDIFYIIFDFIKSTAQYYSTNRVLYCTEYIQYIMCTMIVLR